MPCIRDCTRIDRRAVGMHYTTTTSLQPEWLLQRSANRRIDTAPMPADAGDWSGYNRNLAGDRYSPLAEINTTNVAQLKTICSYTLPEVTALQTGPIVVSGTMYFTTDTISYAIDGATAPRSGRSCVTARRRARWA